MISYEELMQDIDVAKRIMKMQKMDNIYPQDKLLFETYCLPSHNHLTYYARVYKIDESYIMVYIRNEVEYAYGGSDPIRMYPFSWAKRAERMAELGHFFTGIAELSEECVKQMKRLLNYLPAKDYASSDDRIIIDGTFNWFCLYQDGNRKNEVSYRLGEEILGKDSDYELQQFVENINEYLEIDMGYEYLK